LYLWSTASASGFASAIIASPHLFYARCCAPGLQGEEIESMLQAHLDPEQLQALGARFPDGQDDAMAGRTALLADVGVRGDLLLHPGERLLGLLFGHARLCDGCHHFIPSTHSICRKPHSMQQVPCP
jgi:hypothetical protein